MQLLDSEDEILVGNAALCLGNCMEVPRMASSLLSTDIVPVLLKLAGSDARQTAVQLNAGIALGKLCTAEPRYSRTRGASSFSGGTTPLPPGPAPPRTLGRAQAEAGEGTQRGAGVFPGTPSVFSLLSSRGLLSPLLLPLLAPSPPLSPAFLSPLLFQKQTSNFIFFFFLLLGA